MLRLLAFSRGVIGSFPVSILSVSFPTLNYRKTIETIHTSIGCEILTSILTFLSFYTLLKQTDSNLEYIFPTPSFRLFFRYLLLFSYGNSKLLSYSFDLHFEMILFTYSIIESFSIVRIRKNKAKRHIPVWHNVAAVSELNWFFHIIRELERKFNIKSLKIRICLKYNAL